MASDEFGGCLAGIDAQLAILGTKFTGYAGGCIYTETSLVNFTSNKIDNDGMQNGKTSIGSAFYGLNNKFSLIAASELKNNMGNAEDGAVIIFFFRERKSLFKIYFK